MPNKNIRERNNALDICKGIGIIFVVMGHYHLNNTEYNILHKFVYIFHMPLFFYLSAFNLKIDKINLITFIRKRIKRLIVPWVIWSIIFSLITPIFFWLFYKEDILIQSIAKNIFLSLIHKGGFHNSWFLIALFWSQLIIVIFSLILKNNYKFNLTLILIISLSFLLNAEKLKNNIIHSIHVFDVAMASMIFIYFGYLLKNINYRNKLFCMLSFIGIILSYQFNSEIDIVYNQYGNIFLYILGGLAGSYFSMFISNLILDKSSTLSKLLVFVGRNTIWILIFNIYLLYSYKMLFNYFQLNINNWPIWFIIVLLTTLTPPCLIEIKEIIIKKLLLRREFLKSFDMNSCRRIS